jgi:hypothetical protein
LPALVKGDEPSDGGHLILSTLEKKSLLSAFPAAAPLIRRFYSSEDLLYGFERYTLWITDELLPLAESIPFVEDRIRKTRKNREAGGRNKRRLASTPHRFCFITHREELSLVIPELSTGRRQYLQIALLPARDIPNNRLYVAYDPPPHLFALLSSRLHQMWTLTMGGTLGASLNYSAGLVYNTFPVPALSAEQRRVLKDHSREIIKARARHPGKTLAELYNPDTMPQNLLDAHRANDSYLEEFVYGRKFKDDTQRLELIFSMYARMIETAYIDGTLFAKDSKKRAV